MNLIEQLSKDHREFLTLMSRINSLLFDEKNHYFTQGREPKITETVLEMLRQLIDSIRKHEEAEHRLLFPTIVRHIPNLGPIIKDIEREHGRTRQILKNCYAAISKTDTANRMLIDQFLVLSKYMDMHMSREEMEIFEPAKANIPADKLSALAENTEQLKPSAKEAL